MPFLVGCLALVFPRIALFFVWLFGGNYLGRAYDHWIFPVLGFFFLPATTLAFAFGLNSLSQPSHMSPLGWLITGLAVLVDIGLLGGGRKGARDWRERRDRRDRDLDRR